PGTTHGNASSFYTFCSDDFHVVFQGNPYTVQPSLTPNTTTLSTLPGYSTNLGEIGYLYTKYGTTLRPGGLTTSTDGAALQLVSCFRRKWRDAPPELYDSSAGV